MRLLHLLRIVAITSAILATVAPQRAQAQDKPFEPQVGQAGKDVVWVPTPQALVNKMLDMAKVTPQDFLMDLGSGDGRTVITADLDLTTANGREALDRRLVRAAADVCGAAAQVDLDGRNAVRACRVEVLAGARLAADRQVALHSVGAPIELAAR